jgi:hypothetical protein
MLEAQREVSKDDDIPFGIRAIESGIEVDGVWISRTNTPAGSSAASSINLSRGRTNSQLEIPSQAQAKHGSSRASSRPPSSFDLAVNAERINTNESRDTSPSGHHGATRNSTTLNNLEGRQYSSYAPPGQYRKSLSSECN